MNFYTVFIVYFSSFIYFKENGWCVYLRLSWIRTKGDNFSFWIGSMAMHTYEDVLVKCSTVRISYSEAHIFQLSTCNMEKMLCVIFFSLLFFNIS